MIQQTVSAGDVTFDNDAPLSFICGPCALESRDHAIEMADAVTAIGRELGAGIVFKASFDKANRTSVSSGRGIGLETGLEIFGEIKKRFGCANLTDIHTPEQCQQIAASGAVDILQIPAFLCRQTDLLVAAGESGLAINVKKGQFLAPWDMKHVLAKVKSTGNARVMACDRGTSFGYNTLVSDMRGLPTMAQYGQPVIFDATHSVQQPGGQGGTSGGQREFVPVLARAAVATGIAGVFIETHDDPDNALSDGPNMVPLDELKELLATLMAFDQVAKAHPVSL